MPADKTNPFDLSAGVPAIEGNLRPTPKFADRISKRVLFVVFCVVLVVVGIFLFSLDRMDANKGAGAAPSTGPNKKPIDKDAEAMPGELKGAAEAELAKGAANPATLVKQNAVTVPFPIPNDKPDPKKQVPEVVPPTVPATVPALTAEEQAENQAKLDRRTRMAQARSTGLSVKAFSASDTKSAVADGQNAEMASLLAASKNSPGAGAQPGGRTKGDSEQDEKLDFLKNTGKENRGYHPHVAMPALSPNEIKTGSYIPMSLEQAINSDLPGQLTARVTEDVYDSITGCRLLVPAMSKVIGEYDSKIAIGQGRMLVAWNSLVFQDGSELNLAGLQGYDTSGAAGLASDVDNHYWRLFGLTFGLSMITAGVQLSVPQPNAGTNGTAAPQSFAQTVSTALAQQYGALGSQIIGKYIAVQPTLRNFAGERFVVMIPRTIVFSKVWRNRCPAKLG